MNRQYKQVDFEESKINTKSDIKEGSSVPCDMSSIVLPRLGATTHFQKLHCLNLKEMFEKTRRNTTSSIMLFSQKYMHVVGSISTMYLLLYLYSRTIEIFEFVIFLCLGEMVFICYTENSTYIGNSYLNKYLEYGHPHNHFCREFSTF